MKYTDRNVSISEEIPGCQAVIMIVSQVWRDREVKECEWESIG